MTFACFRLMAVLLIFAVAPVRAEPTHINPRLIAESSTPAPGSTVTIAVEMRTEKRWHGYWSNAGEAGFAPRLTWTVPKGVTIGPAQFPVPQTLVVAGLVNYVFNGDHAILFDVVVPKGAAGTAVPIVLDAEWLACTDEVCVPEAGRFALDLMLGEGQREAGPMFDAFRQRLPRPLGAAAQFARTGDMLRLAIPYPRDAAIGDPHFFPAENGLITDAAPQRFSRKGDAILLEVPAPTGTAAVAGVLAIDGQHGLVLTAQPGTVPTGGMPIGPQTLAAGFTAILLALGGAVLGGLILNVMPCVFPIVSLKALSLARAGESDAKAKREALAYAAGVIATCLALGGIILGVRAGGSQIGWAFQLQDPRIVFVLLVLATAITLNMAGFFELRGFGGGQGLVDKGGTQGAFWTGVLAAFVATPCTGPFMAAALGAALVLPVAAALAVFAGLGVGLALPFVAIAFLPGLRRRIPKPGPWMGRFQRALSVPMALTVVALLWLVDRRLGATGFQFALLAILAVVAVAVMTGRSQHLRLSKAMPVVLAAMLIAGVMAIKTDAFASGSAVELKGEPFSAARLEALRKSGKPVFVYFTADWCLTCKVNEKTAIDTAVVRDAFAQAGVQVLIGDWTAGDATITRFLNAQGVSGVPLYLYYAPGVAEPKQLPQVLTPATLADLTSA